ncbi:MAG: hypothetical protein R3B09_35195 [Nannocystaceae bacterium]
MVDERVDRVVAELLLHLRGELPPARVFDLVDGVRVSFHGDLKDPEGHVLTLHGGPVDGVCVVALGHADELLALIEDWVRVQAPVNRASHPPLEVRLGEHRATVTAASGRWLLGVATLEEHTVLLAHDREQIQVLAAGEEGYEVILDVRLRRLPRVIDLDRLLARRAASKASGERPQRTPSTPREPPSRVSTSALREHRRILEGPTLRDDEAEAVTRVLEAAFDDAAHRAAHVEMPPAPAGKPPRPRRSLRCVRWVLGAILCYALEVGLDLVGFSAQLLGILSARYAWLKVEETAFKRALQLIERVAPWLVSWRGKSRVLRTGEIRDPRSEAHRRMCAATSTGAGRRPSLLASLGRGVGDEEARRADEVDVDERGEAIPRRAGEAPAEVVDRNDVSRGADEAPAEVVSSEVAEATVSPSPLADAWVDPAPVTAPSVESPGLTPALTALDNVMSREPPLRSINLLIQDLTPGERSKAIALGVRIAPLFIAAGDQLETPSPSRLDVVEVEIAEVGEAEGETGEVGQVVEVGPVGQANGEAVEVGEAAEVAERVESRGSESDGKDTSASAAEGEEVEVAADAADAELVSEVAPAKSAVEHEAVEVSEVGEVLELEGGVDDGEVAELSEIEGEDGEDGEVAELSEIEDGVEVAEIGVGEIEVAEVSLVESTVETVAVEVGEAETNEVAEDESAVETEEVDHIVVGMKIEVHDVPGAAVASEVEDDLEVAVIAEVAAVAEVVWVAAVVESRGDLIVDPRPEGCVGLGDVTTAPEPVEVEAPIDALVEQADADTSVPAGGLETLAELAKICEELGENGRAAGAYAALHAAWQRGPGGDGGDSLAEVLDKLGRAAAAARSGLAQTITPTCAPISKAGEPRVLVPLDAVPVRIDSGDRRPSSATSALLLGVLIMIFTLGPRSPRSHEDPEAAVSLSVTAVADLPEGSPGNDDPRSSRPLTGTLGPRGPPARPAGFGPPTSKPPVD